MICCKRKKHPQKKRYEWLYIINQNFEQIVNEINFLSSITFILLGACFEHLNEFFLSNSAFRQAKWITENLLNDIEYYNLLKLLEDLVDKSTKEKRKSVFEKLTAFFEKFYGVLSQN